MISLAPLSDSSEIDFYCKKAGIKRDENTGCVAAKSGNEVLGFCLYRLYEGGITVLYIEPKDDVALLDGILRATLHVAASRSAMDARYEGEDNEPLFEKLGFILDKENKKLDIDKLFRGCACENQSQMF